MIAPAYRNPLRYGYGLYPHGRCQLGDCREAACHRTKIKEHSVLVCSGHLPKETIFCPYLGQQEKLFAANERTVLGGGGAGGSKTYAGARLYMKQWDVENRRYLDAQNRGEPFVSKGHALFVRRTVPELLQVVEDFKSYCFRLDPGSKWSEKFMLWTASSGYKVQFGGCQDDSDWEKWYGPSYSLVVVDEAWQFTVEQITEIDGRIRVGDPVLDSMLQLYLLTNPLGGETKAWMRKKFVEVASPETTVVYRVHLSDGRIEERSQVYIPCNVFDNPALVTSGKYEANLLTKSAGKRRALLENDWYVDEGSWIGDDWTAEHVCEPFRIPPGWHRDKSYDFGMDAKGPLHYYATSPDGATVCYRAVTFRGLTAAQVARKIKEIEIEAGEWDLDSDCSMIFGVADSSLWTRQGEGAETRGDQLATAGTGLRPAKNRYAGSRRDAADQIRNRLRTRVTDPFDDSKTVPSLRFFKTTEHKVKTKNGWERTGPTVTIPQLQADQNDPDVWDTDGDDHDCDALGYFCMSRAIHGERFDEKEGDPVVVDILSRRNAAKRTESPFPRWNNASN
jgi:hypothetical protein